MQIAIKIKRDIRLLKARPSAFDTEIGKYWLIYKHVGKHIIKWEMK